MLTATLTAPPLTSDLQRRSRGNQEQSSRLQQQRSSLSQRSLEEETLERRLSQLRQRLWRKKAALQQDQQLVRVLVLVLGLGLGLSLVLGLGPVLDQVHAWSLLRPWSRFRSRSVPVLAPIQGLGWALGNGLGLGRVQGLGLVLVLVQGLPGDSSGPSRGHWSQAWAPGPRPGPGLLHPSVSSHTHLFPR